MINAITSAIKIAFHNYNFFYLIYHLIFSTFFGVLKYLPSPLFDFFRYFFLKLFFGELKTIHIRDDITIYHPKHIFVKKNVSLNEGIFMNGYGGIVIGENTRVGHGCSFLSEDHIYKNKKKPIYLQGKIGKKIVIGKNCLIGAKVTFLKGVNIGDNCIIGSGAVVTKNFLKNTIIAGVPAKALKKR
tara:strand:- start:634 stop:1191 length:558 start_codon:yes stop_codon:yes gene_type:complete